MPPPTRMLIFGTGAIGSIYVSLSRPPNNTSVTVVCRSNYAVKTNGILVRSAIWGHIRCKPNTVVSFVEAAKCGPVDYVIVALKAFPGTAELIAAAVTEERFSSNTIISRVVRLPSIQVSPGIVEHGALERFDVSLNPFTNKSDVGKEQVELLSKLFAAANASAPIHSDIQPIRWCKLSVNAWLNPMSILTLCDDANLLRSSADELDLAKDVMREIGTVAAATGYPGLVSEEISKSQMKQHIDRLERGGKEPSMLVEVLHARVLEVEAILGNAVRIARKFGIKTPYLKMLYILAKRRNFALVKDGQWRPIAAFDRGD